MEFNLSVIVAIAANRAIGKDNDLLWHLSGDLKRFKEMTMGHTILMGRRTYESFPKRPLPGRFHLVMSRNVDIDHPQVKVVRTVEEALSCLPSGEESFLIGGGSLYELFLPYCQTAYVTEVDREYEADTFFPQLDPDQWVVQSCTNWETDEKSGLRYRYVTYRRK